MTTKEKEVRPKITRTYEMQVPSGISVAHTEGARGFTVTNGIASVFVPDYCITSFREALYSIHAQMAEAKETAKQDGYTDD